MSEASSPIVITGGAQRLGLATAIALHSGSTPVVVSYRSSRPALAKLRKLGIETIHADFADNAGIQTFIEELRRRYSSLRAIIHNASEWIPEGGDTPDGELLQRMMSVHVAAPYLINQACTDLLQNYGRQGKYADIIHMSDYIAGVGSRKHIAYAASKAALDNLTLSFAAKLAPFVKVNGIAPSLLMFNQHDDEAYRHKARNKSLLSIAPGESEGVNAVRYLLESRYLTGKTIALDGGRSIAQAS